MKFTIPILLSLVLLLPFPISGQGANLQKGVAAYKNEEYETAKRIWKTLALKGDAKAQYFLGNMYYRGVGVEQDDKMAVKWFKLAAEQGLVQAQNNLGTMYMRGLGVSRDNIRAFIWLHLTALQGDKIGIKNRDLVAKILSASQLKKAEELALKCKKNKYKGC